ncbi:magnesium chelatase subunit ChlI family protein [Bacillus salinus]|uniref:magnesium chelatase subunit ChlI family protein n=1 Tax=Bacillus sp. HMF5848 TaxID=2495421 RepID=UPI00289A78C9|nr:hypothetical protein [Bacillus sp. HMF5848]
MVQRARYGCNTVNSRVSYQQLLQHDKLQPNVKTLLQQISTKRNLSNRSQVKLLRIARTISDLTNESSITEQAIQEASRLNGGGSAGS